MQITISAKSADMRRGYVCVNPTRPSLPKYMVLMPLKLDFPDFFLSWAFQITWCPSSVRSSLSVFLGKRDLSLFKWWATLDSEIANLYIEEKSSSSKALGQFKINLANSTFAPMNDHAIYQWGHTYSNTLTTFNRYQSGYYNKNSNNT